MFLKLLIINHKSMSNNKIRPEYNCVEKKIKISLTNVVYKKIEVRYFNKQCFKQSVNFLKLICYLFKKLGIPFPE